MERGWREKDSGGAGKGGGEVGDDREGCSSVCRIRRWLTPTPRRRSLGRAMTSAKSCCKPKRENADYRNGVAKSGQRPQHVERSGRR